MILNVIKSVIKCEIKELIKLTENKQPIKNNDDVELGNELNLDQEAMDILIATKAGGMITRRLVELGERMLVEDSQNKK